MNEIRFKDSWNSDRDQNSENINRKDLMKNNIRTNFWVPVFFVLFITVLFFMALSFFDINITKFFGQERINGVYSAIFLSNGQVYFGKITEISRKELILENVYYLQANGSGGTLDESGNQFNLFKLGQELHGPEDLMYINKEHIMFYENLRPDSQLVTSINEYN